jgi:hypothetical protein
MKPEDEEFDTIDFENYVKDILAVAAQQKPKSEAAFNAMCQLDINAGYRDEVAEARRRWFGGKGASR